MNHSTGKRCPVLGVRIIKVFMCRIKNEADKWKSKLWEFLLVHCLRVCIWKGAGDDHLVLDSRFSRRWRCVCWSCGLQRPADLLPDNIHHPGAFSCRTNPRSDKYLTSLKLTTQGEYEDCRNWAGLPSPRSLFAEIKDSDRAECRWVETEHQCQELRCWRRDIADRPQTKQDISRRASAFSAFSA